jgi:hypothetical protein
VTVLRVLIDDMTIGDLEDFQTITGMTLDAAFTPQVVLDAKGNKVFDEKGRPEKAVDSNPTVLKALIYLSQRAIDPAFTLDDARNVKVSELEIVSGPLDPTSETD